MEWSIEKNDLLRKIEKSGYGGSGPTFEIVELRAEGQRKRRFSLEKQLRAALVRDVELVKQIKDEWRIE